MFSPSNRITLEMVQASLAEQTGKVLCQGIWYHENYVCPLYLLYKGKVPSVFEGRTESFAYRAGFINGWDCTKLEDCPYYLGELKKAYNMGLEDGKSLWEALGHTASKLSYDVITEQV